jgi:hypothetical protein
MPPAAGGGASLGQIVAKAVTDVLGWKVKTGDAKGFVGALTQAFTLSEVEGHVEARWVPRSYAVQTDLSGGISGAQASVYARGKEAVDQSLPLLDGLYPLDPEAVPEDVAALKAVAKSQLTQLAAELGVVPPRITRVNQYFNLLLGSNTFPLYPIAGSALGQTDPDQVSGTLGNLRDELGVSFTGQDFVNSLEDEQNLSNFRIISDYITSLAQTWLNNVSFLGLNTTAPFWGTQLLLLSRQLSVVAEMVDEVRFTLDSVFIGPSERQTMQLNFSGVSPAIAPIYLEDLLTWIQTFASDEGPSLIQNGGKFGVQNTFYPVALQLVNIVTNVPANTGLPPGFYTPRVQLAISDLLNQLRALQNLAAKIGHVITPEPDFALPFRVTGLQPNSISLATPPPQVYVRGNGFALGQNPLSVTFNLSGRQVVPTAAYFRSESLLIAVLPFSPPIAQGVWNVTVTNPDGTTATAVAALTVTP